MVLIKFFKPLALDARLDNFRASVAAAGVLKSWREVFQWVATYFESALMFPSKRPIAVLLEQVSAQLN